MSQTPLPKILIVDDTPANIRLLGGALHPEHEIIIATNGADALKIAETERPDLILLDIVMPGMDGYEVCRHLKDSPVTKNIPVIFITAKAEEEDEVKGLSLGAVDYILKPFSLPIVQVRVKNYLELKHDRDMLENISTLDWLTGIPNRRRFDEFLETEWRRCARNAAPLSLIMIDIDYFKLYNDSFGHVMGDECLKKVAKELHYSLRRPTDIVSRYGGEEFAAVMPETDTAGAAYVAEMMHSNIAGLNLNHPSSPVVDRVTISIGLASILPTSSENYAVLVKAADRALYEAKNRGRNHTQLANLIR